MSLDVIYESYSTKIKSVYFLLSPSLPFPQKQNGKDVVGVGRENTHTSLDASYKNSLRFNTVAAARRERDDKHITEPLGHNLLWLSCVSLPSPDFSQ